MTYVDTPQGICRFGLARRDVTPPVGIYHRMWGAALHDRSTGVHRPLSATAIVMRPMTDGPDRQVVVAVDHCLLLAREMDALLERVTSSTGIQRSELVVAFSHTHAAGLMDESRAVLPGGELIAPYLVELAARIAEAIREADVNLAPATIAFGSGKCSLAAQRDFYDEEQGIYVCGYNPKEPADDAVQIARVTREDGRLLATLVNYACHPTTLAWDNTLISPDYPGALRDVVEAASGAPCVFLQGASGDLGPVDGYVGETTLADRNGRQLGHAAMSALESLPPPRTRMRYLGPVVSGATIGVWEHQPLAARDLAGKERWQLRRWTVELPYLKSLPSVEQVREDLQTWSQRERQARDAGNASQARDARAMVERMTRLLARLSQLPPGDKFPYLLTLWRTGDAFWLAVEGEPYNLLQRRLRERFPGVPILVLVLANGWRPGYLPIAETYGKGIYQESIAVLEAGCLERVTEEAGDEIARWLEGKGL